MRVFYEDWAQYLIWQPSAAKLQVIGNDGVIDIDAFSLQKWSPMAAEINREEFLGISFSHYIEILDKTKDIQEVLFYIHQTVLHKWDKYDLRNHLKANLYAVQKAAPNNFLQTMPVNNARKPHENPTIGILLCKSADKAFVEYVIRDYNHPMGVATYKTADGMDEKLREALPDMEEMRKLLTEDEEEILKNH